MNPKRGEIWDVRFDPTEGDEIQKTRPAVVLNVENAGRLTLRIVVPLTGWQDKFGELFWMVKLEPDADNGLRKVSAADCVQIRSLSTRRFQRQVGTVNFQQINQMVAAMMLCLGYRVN